jgi:hypothetical protein
LNVRAVFLLGEGSERVLSPGQRRKSRLGFRNAQRRAAMIIEGRRGRAFYSQRLPAVLE